MAAVRHEQGIDLCGKGVGAGFSWPSMEDHLTSPRPKAYDFLIPMAITGVSVTAIIALPTLARLFRAHYKAAGASGADNWRLLFTTLPPAAPFAIAILKTFIVLAPRTWRVLNILSALFEAAAFWAFLHLLLTFIQRRAGHDDPAAALSSVEPVRVWACVTRVPKPRDLIVVRCLVYQFMVVITVVAFLELDGEWVALNGSIVNAIDILSLVLCVFAELSLIRMAHELLIHRRAHLKFWALKALFGANTMSFRICSRRITEDVRVGALCYSSETLAAAWSGGFTAVFAVAVAAIAACAFVPEDLMDGPELTAAPPSPAAIDGACPKPPSPSDCELGVDGKAEEATAEEAAS